MWGEDDTSVPDRAKRRGLFALLLYGVFGQLWDALTGGPFLAGFALALGANSFTFGLLAAIPPLSQLVQIPAAYLVERWRRRKLMVLLFGAGPRTVWLVFALVPLFVRGQAGLTVLLGSMALAASLGGFVGVALNSWVRDLVPQHVMGRFFATRTQYSTAAGMVAGMAGGLFVSYWKGAFPQWDTVAYSFTFGAGVAFAWAGWWALSHVPEPRYQPPAERVSFAAFMGRPFRDRPFRGLLGFLFLWTFATSLAMPFVSVYMLQRLGLGMSAVVAFTTLGQLSVVLFVRVWGGLADRFGNWPVLYTACLLLLGSLLAFPLTHVSQSPLYVVPVLAAIQVLSGVAGAGISLVTNNMVLKASPYGAASAHLTASSLVGAAAGAAAPLLAGTLAGVLSTQELSVHWRWSGPGQQVTADLLSLQGLDFLFLLAAALGLVALRRLSSLKEEGTELRRLSIGQVAQSFRAEVKRLAGAARGRPRAVGADSRGPG